MRRRWLYFPATAQFKHVVSLDSSWLQSAGASREQLLRQIFDRIGITTTCYTLPANDSRIFGSIARPPLPFPHPNRDWNALRAALGVTAVEAPLTTSLNAPLWLPLLGSDTGGSSGNTWTATEIAAINQLGAFVVLEEDAGWSQFNSNTLNAINSPYAADVAAGVAISGDIEFTNTATSLTDDVPANSVTYLESTASVPNSAIIGRLQNANGGFRDGVAMPAAEQNAANGRPVIFAT